MWSLLQDQHQDGGGESNHDVGEVLVGKGAAGDFLVGLFVALFKFLCFFFVQGLRNGGNGLNGSLGGRGGLLGCLGGGSCGEDRDEDKCPHF